MTVRNGIVRKDRLIDLIHEEGTFTERVKMVMYFLFLFRDARYRQFIYPQSKSRLCGSWSALHRE